MYTIFFILFLLVIIGAVWYYVLRPRGVKLPGLPGRSSPKSGICPFCKSDDLFYSPKRGLWQCNKCREIFSDPRKLSNKKQ